MPKMNKVEPIVPDGLEWRSIKDYPNYEVSNIGTVRAIAGRGIKPGMMRYMCFTDNKGYFRVCLSNGYGTKHFSIHSLVAQAFIGGRHDDLVIDHINSDKHDNRVENLRYVTVKQNNLKRYHVDGYSRPKRAQARLTPEMVNEILNSNESACKLAKLFGVSRMTISDAKNGKTHVYLYQKLSDDQVRSIRKDGRKNTIIATEYGVSERHIRDIKNRRGRQYVIDEPENNPELF